MTILIAPDKFKGSLTAEAVCDIIADSLLLADPSLQCIRLPLADGGDGTCAVLTKISGGTRVPCTVRDPLFRSVDSHYGLSPDRQTAFIEMAAASGLWRLQPSEYNPLHTASIGTGDLIRAALSTHQVSSIIIGIGGSATNDGGIGMAAALGAQFYDATGAPLLPTGQNLLKIHHIDLSAIPAAVRALKCTLLCDVDNPLHGPNGAARVFGPQKGATPAMIDTLDAGLQHLADLLHQQFGHTTDFPGAGAAGGLPAMLTLLMPVQIHSGTAFITRFANLESHVQHADIIISGEGRIDAQTLSGKLVKGVAALTARHNKPLVVITGSSQLTPEQAQTLGISKLITLVTPQTPLGTAMADAPGILRHRVREELIPYIDSIR